VHTHCALGEIRTIRGTPSKDEGCQLRGTRNDANIVVEVAHGEVIQLYFQLIIPNRGLNEGAIHENPIEKDCRFIERQNSAEITLGREWGLGRVFNLMFLLKEASPRPMS